MALLVSIHDVTPAFAAQAQRLWSLCRQFGVTPALLVVPNWHGKWPLQHDDAFIAWVRDCADKGAEVFLHGERHDEVGLPRGLIDHGRALGRTAREGEFLTLRRASAQLRIERGLELLRTLDVSPIGFIPPAWLAREATHDAVKASGLRISEDESSVRVHARSAHLRAPAVRWSGRTAARAHMSAAFARARWHLQRRAPLVRIALHPQDLAHAITERSVYREVERWLTLGPVQRYDEL